MIKPHQRLFFQYRSDWNAGEPDFSSAPNTPILQVDLTKRSTNYTDLFVIIFVSSLLAAPTGPCSLSICLSTLENSTAMTTVRCRPRKELTRLHDTCSHGDKSYQLLIITFESKEAR